MYSEEGVAICLRSLYFVFAGVHGLRCYFFLLQSRPSALPAFLSGADKQLRANTLALS